MDEKRRPLVPGDVVYPLAGGPRMWVHEVDPLLICEWFSADGQHRKDNFSEVDMALELPPQVFANGPVQTLVYWLQRWDGSFSRRDPDRAAPREPPSYIGAINQDSWDVTNPLVLEPLPVDPLGPV